MMNCNGKKVTVYNAVSIEFRKTVFKRDGKKSRFEPICAIRISSDKVDVK